MKYLILLLSLSCSLTYAQTCKEKILANYGDSKHMTVYAGEVMSTSSEMMDKQMALNAANFMNTKFNCPTFLSTHNAEVICTEKLQKNHDVCNVKTYYGFYIIFKDYVDTVHMVFSRWD